MCQKFECFLYLIQIFDFHQRPVLSCAFQDPIHVWSGCLDGKLKSFDINSNRESVIGMHENTIRCIEFSNEINAVVTGSWDGTVKIWDARTNSCTGTYTQPDKVYTMSLAGEKLVVGTASRKVNKAENTARRYFILHSISFPGNFY